MLWHAIVGALLADAGDALAVVRRPGRDAHRGRVHAGDDRRGRRPAGVARGPRAARHRRSTMRHAPCEAATATLRALEEGGWTSLVDAPLAFAAGRLGAEAVAERTEAFDPLAVVLRRRVGGSR